MRFSPADEQAARLNGLGGGYLVPVVTGITISAPNCMSLRKLGEYRSELIRFQTAAPVSIPVVIIDSDSDDDGLRYPSDEGSESDEDHPPIDAVSVSDESDAGFPTPASTCGDNAPVDAPANSAYKDNNYATPDPHTDNADTDAASEDEGEDEELVPGAYLECKVCGTQYDLKSRKSAQPWQSNYQREAAEIGSGLPYNIAIV